MLCGGCCEFTAAEDFGKGVAVVVAACAAEVDGDANPNLGRRQVAVVMAACAAEVFLRAAESAVPWSALASEPSAQPEGSLAALGGLAVPGCAATTSSGNSKLTRQPHR